MPRFSILIPTTGRTHLTRLAVQSVLSQTFPDVEIVVTDTAEGNEVKAMLDEFSDARIKYCKTPEGNPSLGWDFAYKQSNGEYVLWLDDDNYLLPYALKVFDRVIRETGADIVTAYHVYQYDRDHIRRDRRNSLGIRLLFDNQIRLTKPREALYKIINLRNKIYHPAATFFSRRICEEAVRRIGYVVLPYKKCNHSLHPILFSFAKSPAVEIGVPLSIIGRLEKSITQARIHQKGIMPSSNYRFSPVSGNCAVNHVIESFLETKYLLEEELHDVPVHVGNSLLYKYAPALFFGHTSWASARILWPELQRAIVSLPDKTEEEVRGIRRFAVLAYLVQPIKSLGLWNWVKDMYRLFQNFVGRDARKRLNANSDFLVSLLPYNISDIADLAKNLRSIILKETGRDISYISTLGDLEKM